MKSLEILKFYLSAAPLAILVLCTFCVGDTLEVEGEDAQVASGRSTYSYTAPATVTIGTVGAADAPISLSTNMDTTARNLKTTFSKHETLLTISHTWVLHHFPSQSSAHSV